MNRVGFKEKDFYKGLPSHIPIIEVEPLPSPDTISSSGSHHRLLLSRHLFLGSRYPVFLQRNLHLRS